MTVVNRKDRIVAAKSRAATTVKTLNTMSTTELLLRWKSEEIGIKDVRDLILHLRTTNPTVLDKSTNEIWKMIVDNDYRPKIRMKTHTTPSETQLIVFAEVDREYAAFTGYKDFMVALFSQIATEVSIIAFSSSTGSSGDKYTIRLVVDVKAAIGQVVKDALSEIIGRHPEVKKVRTVIQKTKEQISYQEDQLRRLEEHEQEIVQSLIKSSIEDLFTTAK